MVVVFHFRLVEKMENQSCLSHAPERNQCGVSPVGNLFHQPLRFYFTVAEKMGRNIFPHNEWIQYCQFFHVIIVYMIIANVIIINRINKKAGKNLSDVQPPALEKGACTRLNKGDGSRRVSNGSTKLKVRSHPPK